MSLAPLEQLSLPERVARTLHDRIARGEYRSGSQLPHQRVLARELGVSLAVVRESLALLAAGGVVWSRSGKGTFVADAGEAPLRFPAWTRGLADDTEVAEALEARELLETAAVRLAARRRTREQLAELEARVAEMEAARADADRFAAADLAFHELLADASRNRPLAGALVGLRRLIAPELARRADAAIAGRRTAQAVEAHRRVLAAVRRRDPDAAARELARILARARRTSATKGPNSR